MVESGHADAPHPRRPGRPTHPVDVLLLLTDGEHVLMALRSGTGYADGQWPASTYPYSAACVTAWRASTPLTLSGW
ncbi:hypothetical protein Q0Z83_052430 [Actinoplanes sichuanensis]|uniref:Nudix hydrolase domain-containing protein n=1 Tax=Actinoplanes sichuanensis TaxID=512349 RepID=A0ABW4ARZ2_9ACTN|nr:hypothetical protein [Actinoplanes sichuanensis]BEL07052.1 hypothetical protein Q0Z83_052430 [Actinoplanes sichuanensis]